ncbi:alpha/beta hydrolase, partial [Micromonospora zhanjiangensis]
SYGALVVGLAAPALGPQVTDLVALGAPGMGADRMDRLGTGARVWAALAPDDWIRRVPEVRIGRLATASAHRRSTADGGSTVTIITLAGSAIVRRRRTAPSPTGPAAGHGRGTDAVGRSDRPTRTGRPIGRATATRCNIASGSIPSGRPVEVIAVRDSDPPSRSRAFGPLR